MWQAKEIPLSCLFFLIVRNFPSTYAMISNVGWLRCLIVAAKWVESDDLGHGEQSALTLR